MPVSVADAPFIGPAAVIPIAGVALLSVTLVIGAAMISRRVSPFEGPKTEPLRR